MATPLFFLRSYHRGDSSQLKQGADITTSILSVRLLQRAQVYHNCLWSLKRVWKSPRRLLERLKTLFVEGELSKAEYHQRKSKIEGQRLELSQKLKTAPPDVKTLEDLLPQQASSKMQRQ